MGKISREWHEAHRMPARATDRQRAEWHYEHALRCGCREITPTIAKLLIDNGFSVPPRRAEAKA